MRLQRIVQISRFINMKEFFVYFGIFALAVSLNFGFFFFHLFCRTFALRFEFLRFEQFRSQFRRFRVFSRKISISQMFNFSWKCSISHESVQFLMKISNFSWKCSVSHENDKSLRIESYFDGIFSSSNQITIPHRNFGKYPHEIFLTNRKKNQFLLRSIPTDHLEQWNSITTNNHSTHKWFGCVQSNQLLKWPRIHRSHQNGQNQWALSRRRHSFNAY